MSKFFISCPLKLENECLKELQDKWPLYYDAPLPNTTLVTGGIELELELAEGLKLNHFMRSANRILLRIKEQKCRDLPKLFNILSKINWKDYLKKEEARFEISAKESRLMHTGRIEKTAKEALEKYFNANKIKESMKEEFKDSAPTEIFLRFFQDTLTISIDTSGELLYRRSNKESFKGLAPLRNNYAFIMLQFLKEHISNATTLVDPMCGSGTFLKEARDYYSPIDRSFAYEVFHPRIKVENKEQQVFAKLVGRDREEEIIQKLQDEKDINFECFDLMRTEKTELEKVVCILNPPYGKKVKVEGDRNLFFNSIIDKCFSVYSATRVGIIIPNGVKTKLKPKAKLRCFNNGIWVDFCIYTNRI